MAPPKKTVSKEDWLLRPEFRGIKPGNIVSEAFCTMCKKSIQLSNMGIEALKSHVSGEKHVAEFNKSRGHSDIRLFTASVSSVSSRKERNADPDEPLTLAELASAPPTGSAAASSSATPASSTVIGVSSPRSTASSAVVPSSIMHYCVKDDTTAAEIVWCLQAIENHSSIAATARQAALFQRMFPDSLIAKEFQLGATKVGYSITFGLGPFFFEQVLNDARNADAFVVGFDEILNKKSQQLQMDIFIVFWSEKTNDVQCRYFCSAFLGHSRATDLSKALQEQLKQLKITKMLQVAMDGPNVNFAATRELSLDIKRLHGDQCSLFLDLGSCGLHTVSNSYKQAFRLVKWKLFEFLRACYNVFKDVPARRSDYIRFSEETEPVFPQKFCAVRWLENESVALTAIKAMPFLTKFVAGVEEEKIKIDSKSFHDMEKGLEDKLLPAKLAFFAYVAQQVKPFLKEYQCTEPMIPFLYTDLSSKIRDIMEHFVKPQVLDEATSVAAIDITKEENLIPAAQIKLGHATKSELRKVNTSTEQMKQFTSDCKSILVKMCQILVNKSPESIKYRVAKYVTFCDPALIATNLSASETRLSNALQAFMAKNWLTGEESDRIESDFKALTAKAQFKVDCKNYSRSDQRIDHFWRANLEGQESYKFLFSFLKRVLILSHGQAFVERGFSINKNLIVENQIAKSLVAQRHVYDAVKAAGGVASFEVTKKLMAAYRLARSNQKEEYKRRSQEKQEEMSKVAQKRTLSEKLAELKAKRAKLASEKTSQISALDDEIAALLKFG